MAKAVALETCKFILKTPNRVTMETQLKLVARTIIFFKRRWILQPTELARMKREAQIWIISIHSMISTFMAAGIIPAYVSMAEEYEVTVHEASYLSSSQVILIP